MRKEASTNGTPEKVVETIRRKTRRPHPRHHTEADRILSALRLPLMEGAMLNPPFREEELDAR